jgi:hypothetical protein
MPESEIGVTMGLDLQAEALAHSTIGASSMYRWAACPGSVRLSRGIESAPSSYADEGTDAHALAARWLTTGKQPSFPDPEAYDAVKVYVDFVFSQYTEKDDTLLVEHRFDLSKVHPGCFGTADAVVYKGARKHLIVADYKHGAGIFVSVKNNPQLRYYALGALLTCGFDVDTVEMVVIQPRIPCEEGVIRREVIPVIELLDFMVELKDYAVATEAPEAPLVSGEHCRFCPAARLCPELAAQTQTQAIAKYEFSPVLSYDPEHLRKALDMIPALKAFIKNVDEFAYAEAEAGRCPPGYKLVAKRGTRKWKDEAQVMTALKTMVKPTVYLEAPTLKSPTQLEKCMDKKLLAPFIETVVSGHTLVAEDDPRPAVKLDAKTEFAALPFEEGG